MTFAGGDFGVLGNLGKALGIFEADGSPNADWFQNPEASLESMLANETQREALIAFVDEAMGGADRTTESGVTWLPIVEVDDPDIGIAVTIDASRSDALHIGVGLRFTTSSPGSSTTLSVPLFRAQKEGGPAVSNPFLLGSPGGRIRIATAITVDAGAPVPGHARLGAIGLEVDVPTAPSDPKKPVFGLSLTGLQLPGAQSPRDVRVVADGAEALDDALLDLVMSLVKAQADTAAAGSPIAALGGLLGLKSGDAIPDFPIGALPARGALAIADWVRQVLTEGQSRADWLGALASLLGGVRAGDRVEFDVGGSARLALSIAVATGPSGNPRLTPGLTVELGDAAARVQAVADVCHVDLVTGDASALPRLGLWAAAGTSASRILDLTVPTVARADTLRVGFALDGERRLNFVLAADGVRLGAHDYATLDLTSPDAVMDAAGNTVGDIANDLLAGLGTALGAVGRLIGLDAPAGISTVPLPALMSDPLGAVGGYWMALGAAPAAMKDVLETLRGALADASQAASAVRGAGTAADPWRFSLIGPLEVELVADGSVLTTSLAISTSVDTLGQRCTVLDTRLAATLARVDLAARTATLMAGVEATLTARERGANPRRARLELPGGVTLTSDHVGVRLSWTPSGGIAAGVTAPSLVLDAGGLSLPVSLPSVDAAGNVELPPEAWDAVEVLAGHLGGLIGGFVGDAMRALGWTRALGEEAPAARLRIADVLSSPDATLQAFLPPLLLSDRGPDVLGVLRDLFGGAGGSRGVLAGSGTPDDPYRLAIDPGLPNVAVWFPPSGLEGALAAGAGVLRGWEPGSGALSAAALASGLREEAGVASDVAALIDGRPVEDGLAALSVRWAGGDGRIAPPVAAPSGVTVRRVGVSAPQLLASLNVPAAIGRTPSTVVFVALGEQAFTAAPAARRVDLSTAGLDATMFTLPPAATGEWFVALGTRAACRAAGSTTDGTPEQAARLSRLLQSLAAVSGDLVVVAVAGAGHAARVAAEATSAVRDLVLLGTPLSAISLTALSTQPTADALRLLQRLLPAPGAVPETEDLALGRGLVESMTDLLPLPDPGAELRPAAAAAPPPRAGLNVVAFFGEVSAEQVSRAVTAVVAAGLQHRAAERVEETAEPPDGVHVGLGWQIAPDASGALSIAGSAELRLLSVEAAGARTSTDRALRVRLRVGDRAGWLISTPEAELRAVSVDLQLPLDGASAGSAKIALHDARVFGQSWEALVAGNVAGAMPVLPEARVLLGSAVQRLVADAGGTASAALSSLLSAIGLIDAAAGVIPAALDRLVHDPGGLIRDALEGGGNAPVQAALGALLGSSGAGIELASRAVRVQGGSESSGRFGWLADVTAGTSGITGELSFGPAAALPTVGGLRLALELRPLRVSVVWHRSGGDSETVALWPAPDAGAIARVLAKAAPSLGAHVALELMRRADEAARPIIDAVLDAFGFLSGAAGDAERALRPLAGFLDDPAGWLRSAGSLAASPLKIQALFDALRPLLGVAGAPGSALSLANGVELSAAASGAGARLRLLVDPAAWTAAAGATSRLAGGVGASLDVGPSGPPSVGLELNVGLPGAAPGRQAVHARIGTAGLEVFLRPAAGADISLVPFAGFGALAALAEAALPFLLDRLAEIAGTPGELVRTVGDAMGLRSGTPRQFSAEALHAWAADPVGALNAAVPSITTTALTAIAPILDDFLPASVGASATASELSVAVSGVTLSWSPSDNRITLAAPDIAVPGIETLGLRLAVSDTGLDELGVAVGPARIDAGGVLLRPFASVTAGDAPAAGRRVAVGLSADDTHHFAARWSLDTGTFDLVASDGVLASAVDSTAPADVALRIVEVIADLVAAVALAQASVQQLLDTPVGGKDVRFLLRGVVLEDVAAPAALIDDLFDPGAWLGRLHKLFLNIASIPLSIPVENLTFGIRKDPATQTVGLEVGVVDRFELVKGDVMLWLENESSWITPDPGGGGLFVGFLSAAALTFRPTLVVNGLGLRIGKSSGPLLDIGLTLESIAVHVFAAIDEGGVEGAGVELQFSNLAVSASGAQGDNGVAQGIMRDSGPTPPKPAFSPALAIQKHGSGSVGVSLRAGDGDGPWWIAIQKGFGPLYLEQIGFGTTMPQGRLERISLLMDGSVSLFGLTCAVDDLQITYIAANNDFFNPASWAVDLAGLAVSANMAGVTLAGGLLKQTTPQGIEYLGMLLGRFAVYGLTVYGGYGEGEQNGEKFTAFFAIGAVNGPIGGPPAFFLMGIGGGFGINRKLVVPTDLSNFGDYPLIQALDIAATPSDPMTQLRALGQYFPMQKGTFWFAAGLAFNSFALVDGIAVLGVQIGDGLDISLLGLARMALPRPQAALVSIELALLVRFSSSEGVLWIQGQLTDNSWLLYPDIKLTGGFAYVIWFKGQNKGHFVLTLGGYHPSFHRDGYPEVPRLGLRWSIGDYIVIKSGSYFALTSEALMAGGDFEASATFGPAWAEVKFGADGIVYFDPFSYDVSAYARIAAGITIDTWIFGEITISISLGARIHVLGPDFRGSVTFEVGPVELTFEFGGSDRALREPLGEGEFITKYLEAAESGKARAHAVMTNTGALPAKGEDSTPDGTSSRPFVVVAEFSLTFTTTVPATVVKRVNAATTTHPSSHALGVAPRNVANATSEISVGWYRGGARPYPFVDTVRPFGRFPAGVWGQPQDTDNRKVPTADMIEALCELDLVSRGTPSAPGPEVPYYQVEIGPRRPLPFTRSAVDVSGLRSAAQALTGLVTQPVGTDAAFDDASRFLAKTATPLGLASFRGERQAPPRLGTLTEGLEFATQTTIPEIAERPGAKEYDHFIDAPVVVGLMPRAGEGLSVAPRARTTVKGAEKAWRVSPPTLASVEAGRSRSIAARLVLSETPAAASGRQATVIAAQAAPPTGLASAPVAFVRRSGAPVPAPLADFESALTPGAGTAGRTASKTRAARPGALLPAGQTAVLKLPNARNDAGAAARPRLAVSGAAARVVVLESGGGRVADLVVGPGAAASFVEVPRGAERIVVLGLGAGSASSPSSRSSRSGLAGWHAGLQMPYVGWTTAVAPGCIVRASGDRLAAHRERYEAGWVSGAELARGTSTVTTTFAASHRTVVIVLDDPTAAGDPAMERRLLLGLSGATRALDALGAERAPVLLTMDNRSVLAYDIVPVGEAPVVVTVASQAGWSLAGVMASGEVDARGALALVAARGLDAALEPLLNVGAGEPGTPTRVAWSGPRRDQGERLVAKAQARGGVVAVRTFERRRTAAHAVRKAKGRA